MGYEKPSLDSSFCIKCGTKNPSYAAFCMECGIDLKNTTSDLKETKGQNLNLSSEMESLELNPAESFLLLDLDANGKEMLKLTMLDLLARRVIIMDTWEEEKGLLVKKPTIIHEVGRGENFQTDLKPYEELFRKPLYIYKEIEIQEFIKKVLKEFSSTFSASQFSRFKNIYIRTPLIEEGYIEKVKKQGITSREKYQLTDYGRQVRERIKDILDDADNLGEWVDTEPERAKAFISAIGTHIFILNYDLDTLRFLKNRLEGVKSQTAKFYPYYLYPASFLVGIRGGKLMDDEFDMDVIDSFEYFDSFDSFDDVFDFFDVGDDGGFDDGGGE